MEPIELLVQLLRLFPGSSEAVPDLGRVGELLRKEWGFSKVAFLAWDGRGLRDPEREGTIRLKVRDAWRGPIRRPSGAWRILWPVRTAEGPCGAWAFGTRNGGSGFSRNEERVLELLGTWTGSHLEIQALRATSGVGFDAILAHEIRNPLAALNAMGQLIPERKDDPSFQGTLHRTLVEETERLIRMMEDWMGPKGPRDGRHLPFELRETAERALRLMGPLLRRAGLEAGLEPGEPILLEGDESRIQGLLLELLQNSIRSCGPSCRVSLGIRRMGPGKKVLITLRNDGPRIPPKELKGLFRGIRSDRPEGRGLGLKACRRTVEDHRGRMTVRNLPRRGVEFRILLPAEPVQVTVGKSREAASALASGPVRSGSGR